MDIPSPSKHRRLVLWELPIPELPGMHPQLLAVEVPNLEDPIPSKEWVSMTLAHPSCHQAHKPFLVAKQGLPNCPILEQEEGLPF